MKILQVDLCRNTHQPELTMGAASQFVVVNMLAVQDQ